MYARWQARLPRWIEVVALDLPGRGRLRREPLEHAMPAVVSRLLGALPSEAEQPFALFGHSVGALVAFELAYQLEQRGGTKPLITFVSGSPAPSIRQSPLQSTSTLSDDALMARLEQLHGTPTEALANPELMALVLPVLRADLSVAENYERHARLSSPLHVLGGGADSIGSADLWAWRQHTSERDIDVDILPGGHFFIHSSETEVMQLVERRLARQLARVPAAITHSCLEP